MELGTIKRINIDAEMQASYLDYAMSVIVARALPDVRDGLKPVHRRILYAMYDLGLKPDQPYKKSARIVGEVLGKYHPHGDAAVYEAMVRMAQDFSLRYPLVDGQGNFGSIDGDNAAAMRYTEARLAKIAMEMLNDIEKDTVNWGDNFDGTLKEPLVLPGALPNLVVNGSSGIAVGMSTNIPPHNLGETCDALCYLIDNYDRREDVTVEDLMKFIPGPDFPTGGVVFRYGAPGQEGEREDRIAQAYASGRGMVTMQARAHIEEMSRNRSRIVVTELPYGSNKTTIIERIAELARDGKIEGLTDLRDESDRTGMRLCIEMTRTVEPRDILAMLYKYTPLQQTFGMSLLALVDGEPKLLSLKRMLLHFLEHRQEVILRRSKHDLAKAKARAHILEGLLRALDILDEIIALIRASRTADIARQGLMKQFSFSELQAQAILDMQLRRLAALERKKLQDEYRDVIALIRELEALIASPKKVLALIRQNLVDLKATYGDARRTQITDQARGALTVHDVLPEEDVWVTVRSDGTVGRAAGRLPAGAAAPQFVLEGNTHCDLYLISRRGQATRIGVHQLPDGAGANHWDLGGLRRGDEIAAAFTADRPNGEPVQGYLVLATARGAIKRINLADLAAAAQANPNVIKLDEEDSLAWAATSSGGGEILLATAGGQVIRFAEDDVRPMGLPAGGIAGIKLQSGDAVVGGAVLNPENADRQLTLLTSAGYGRRSPLADFPAKGRGTQGVAARLATKSGPIVACLLVKPTGKLLVAVTNVDPKPLSVKAIPLASRSAAGKVVLVLGANQAERVVLLPEGGVAPEALKTNGSGPAEKPKRATRKVDAPAAAAQPKPATPVRTKAAEPKATGTRETAPKAGAPARARPPAAKAEAPAPPPETPASKPAPARKAAAASAATSAPPAKAEPAPPKTKAATAKPEPAAAATKKAPTGKVPPPAAAKAEPPATQPTATKSKAPAAKREAATAKSKAPTPKAEPAPAKATGQVPAEKSTSAKKPARPPAPPDDIVSRRGKAGVLARPTVTDSGQMLLVPPDTPPAEEPPKTPRKGTAK